MHHKILLRFTFLIVTLFLRNTLVYAVDEDGDGMSDVWERLYGVPASDAALDYDGDGMDNRAESAASTDPSDYSSALTADLTRDTASGLASIAFPTVPARRYKLQVSTDLANWLSVGSVIVGSDDTATFAVSVTGSNFPKLFPAFLIPSR